MSHRHPLSRLAFLLLFAVFALTWFGSLVPRHLAKTDEGRYGEIPREMVATGDWLTPRLDGLKYFEKPALQYWTTAAAYAALGARDWTTRLWTGVTGFAGVLMAGLAARRLYGPAAGIYAAAVLASSLLYFLMAHVATLDMGVSFFMNAGLCCALLARRADSTANSRAWMLACWAALALAVLSKGLEGIVLPGSVLLLYLGLTRDWTFLARLEPWRGPLLFLAISAPWFIAVSIANPDFAHFFFIHEHFERFLTTSHHREGPWWYFAPILALGMVPWIFVLPGALATGLRETHLPRGSEYGRYMPSRLLVIWSVFIFGFFSISSSKLPSYILPIFPALAILIGAHLARLTERATFRLSVLTAVLGALTIALGLNAVRFAPATGPDVTTLLEAYTRFGRGIAAAGVLWLAGAVIAALLARRTQVRAALLLLALCSLLAEATGLASYQALDRFASAQYVATLMEDFMQPDTALYSVEMYEQTLPFYLGRTMTLVNQRDELDFGLRAEPGRGIDTLAAFDQRWRTGGDAMAVMPPTTFDKLRAMNLPMRVILKDRRFVVVSKP